MISIGGAQSTITAVENYDCILIVKGSHSISSQIYIEIWHANTAQCKATVHNSLISSLYCISSGIFIFLHPLLAHYLANFILQQ